MCEWCLAGFFSIFSLAASLKTVIQHDIDSRIEYVLQVVLDLDETLVCAYETSSLPALLCNQAMEAGLKWFELECVSSDKVLICKSF